jgi:hypothetical protein
VPQARKSPPKRAEFIMRAGAESASAATLARDYGKAEARSTRSSARRPTPWLRRRPVSPTPNKGDQRRPRKNPPHAGRSGSGQYWRVLRRVRGVQRARRPGAAFRWLRPCSSPSPAPCSRPPTTTMRSNASAGERRGSSDEPLTSDTEKVRPRSSCPGPIRQASGAPAYATIMPRAVIATRP